MAFIFSITVVNAENEPNILINNKEVIFDVAPIIMDGRTLVPVRPIFQEFNLSLLWDESTSTIIAVGQSEDGIRNSIALQINSKNAIVNGETIELEVPAILYESRTFVPLSFIADSIDAETNWEPETKTVTINTK